MPTTGRGVKTSFMDWIVRAQFTSPGEDRDASGLYQTAWTYKKRLTFSGGIATAGSIAKERDIYIYITAKFYPVYYL